MYNPLQIAGAKRVSGRRRRNRIGAEFSQCPDGTFVKGNATAEKCGTVPQTYTPPYTPPAGGGSGGGGPGWVPSGGGSGGGEPYTPPTGTGGGGSGGPYTPPSVVDIPVNIPVTIPTGPNCAPPAQVCPENQKRYIMPFIPDAGYVVTVAAGATVQFVGKPQKLFKPDRLIVASTIAPYFNIINLMIANIPQSLTQGPVAADIYSEVATNMEMSFDQAYPGIDIVVVAVNKSSVTQTFQIQLAGWAVG